MTRRTPWLSLLWLVLVIASSVAAPLLTAHDPIQPVAVPLDQPKKNLLLGSDQLGRDLWARLVYGGRATMSASLLAAAITISGGLLLGLGASFLGGWFERLLLLLFNATMAVPGLLLAMLFVASMGPGFPSVILAAGLSGIPGFARLIHSQAGAVRSRPFIEAATALGAGKLWIYTFHILPNLRIELLSFGTTYLAWTFTGITTLNFLGLAGDPSIPEWGVLLNTGRAFLIQAPQLVLLPGVLISLTILSFFSLGEWFSSARLPLYKTLRSEEKTDQDETI
ncbi:MAG: ABC transporter permease [Anaerolineales bacterium]|nr:ABC transporter permease [Anaerolineales bacterium]